MRVGASKSAGNNGIESRIRNKYVSKINSWVCGGLIPAITEKFYRKMSRTGIGSNGSDERRVRMYRKEGIGSRIRIGSDGSDKRRVNVCRKSCRK